MFVSKAKVTKRLAFRQNHVLFGLFNGRNLVSIYKNINDIRDHKSATA
jgi:hypothetical protein